MAISPELTTTPAWTSVRRGAFRWDIAESFHGDWLDESGELPLAGWLADGQAQIVKSGPHRAVYRLMLPPGNFYLKHYRVPDWQAVLQNLVRPCKADLEWRAAREVARLGLKTFETIAVGRRSQAGMVTDNFLISREITDTEALDEFVLQSFPALGHDQQQAARREIAQQLGQMSARLHLGGLLHRDLHPGNVLIRQSAGGLQLYLIDLHALRRYRNLTRKQVAGNLALINNFFARRSLAADRLRFLRAYAEVWNQAGFHASRFDRESMRFIEGICLAELEQADRRGDKKWRRGNRRLIILENHANPCRGLAGLGRKQLLSLLAQPECLFDDQHLIAWQKRDQKDRRAAIELVVDGKPVRAIAKCLPKANLARNAWEMGHGLVRRGLPAPRPLLFVESQSGDWDYLAVEQIPGAVSLKQRIAVQRDSLPEREWESWVNAVITAAGRQLRKLHEHGFHQPNLSLSSFLIGNDAERTSLGLVGFESMRQYPRIDSQLVIQSLAHGWESLPSEFCIRLTQGLRFLRAYLGSRFAGQWKTYWRGIANVLPVLSKREAA